MHSGFPDANSLYLALSAKKVTAMKEGLLYCLNWGHFTKLKQRIGLLSSLNHYFECFRDPAQSKFDFDFLQRALDHDN